ncbi:hypothetical protein LC567_08360 [Fusobacterium animalis]
MWLTKAHTSQEAPTSTSGSSSLIQNKDNNFYHLGILSGSNGALFEK